MGFRHGLFTVHAKPEVSPFPFTDYKFKYLTLRLKKCTFLFWAQGVPTIHELLIHPL